MVSPWHEGRRTLWGASLAGVRRLSRASACGRRLVLEALPSAESPLGRPGSAADVSITMDLSLDSQLQMAIHEPAGRYPGSVHVGQASASSAFSGLVGSRGSFSSMGKGARAHRPSANYLTLVRSESPERGGVPWRSAWPCAGRCDPAGLRRRDDTVGTRIPRCGGEPALARRHHQPRRGATE